MALALFLGESGLGKSTLMSSLFLNDLYKDRKVPGVEGKLVLYSGRIRLYLFVDNMKNATQFWRQLYWL